MDQQPSDNAIRQLESFITELDQLLQVPSIPVNEHTANIIEMKTAKLIYPQRKIRTRNVKGIYRREHPEVNVEINAKLPRSSKKKAKSSPGNIGSTKVYTVEVQSKPDILKPEIAIKGGFILLPKKNYTTS